MRKLGDMIKETSILLYTKGSSCNYIADKLGIGKTTVKRWTKPFRRQSKKPTYEWLSNAVNNNKTTHSMAEECEVHIHTIRKWLKEVGLKAKVKLTEEHKAKISPVGRRHSEETKQKMRESQLREKGHNWKGGVVSERFSSPWKHHRNIVLIRDEHKCQMCGATKQDDIYIDVHHRIPFRFFRNAVDGHDISNLLTLCRRCHTLIESKLTLKDISIGRNPQIWNYVNLYGTYLGDNVSIGSFVEIGSTKIGDRTRVGKGCFIPEGVTIQEDCFIAPHVCFTNDFYPPSGKENWKPTLVKQGASIGANATIICGVTIGEKAFVAAGAVVTKNVPDGEMCIGVPALVKGERKYA